MRKRSCDCCGVIYDVASRKFSRGWDHCCDKTCANIMKERKKKKINNSPLQKKIKAHLEKKEQKLAEKINNHLGATEGLTFNISRI